MLIFKGKYTNAHVMIDELDQETTSQIHSFINHEVFTNPICIMPDCHAGKGAVIGFTMKMSDKIIPNVVGVDIGCGMLSIPLNKNLSLSIEEIDRIIRNEIPFGTNVHNKYQIDLKFEGINRLNAITTESYNRKFNTNYKPTEFGLNYLYKKCDQIGINVDRVLSSIGTLGGGNHFIEIGRSETNDRLWITIHSGSRQFGLKIANYWQKKAGKEELSYLQGDDMFGYLTDLQFAQFYSAVNRQTMANIILSKLFIPTLFESAISTVHNFVDFIDFIIRKGAIRSYKEEKMIIPFNMEDGLLICRGKSNPDWNYSAPHGAGRIGSRRWAKENLSLQEAQQRMKEKGIYTSRLPVDELKGAYKDPTIIENAIDPTADIIDRIKPILSMKE